LEKVVRQTIDTTMTRRAIAYKGFVEILKYLGIYFIALVLVAFAISKFLNAQFQTWNYTAYLPLGEVDNFSLAWSFFGRSYTYNLFLGITEFLAATLLLFNRTRLLGLLLALGIYVNLMIINIEFEIGAIRHTTIEFIIVLLLLIPYVKNLKKFFWDLGGEFNHLEAKRSKLMGIYMPLGFITILSITMVVFLNGKLASQDKIIGAYKISAFTINGDTLEIGQGKFTKTPMFYFEFGDDCSLSVRDSIYFGRYSADADSVYITLHDSFENISHLTVKMDGDESILDGVSDHGESIEIKMERVKKKY
jgi:hypothetical protein